LRIIAREMNYEFTNLPSKLNSDTSKECSISVLTAKIPNLLRNCLSELSVFSKGQNFSKVGDS